MSTRLNKNFTHFINDGIDIEFVFSDIDDLNDANDIKWAFSVDEDSTPLITKTLSSGITIDTVDTRKCIVTLAPANTSSRSAGNYHHQLRVQDSANVWHTAATGTMTLKKSIFENS
jgi:hypothetical protein